MGEIRDYNPMEGPPKDGLTKYYDHPQDYGKGWNRRTGLDEERIGRNWPFQETCDHRFLTDECTKCGRKKDERAQED